MAPDGTINENNGEQEEEQEQEPNIIDLNNYGMKPYAWRYEGSGGGGGGEGGGILKVTTDPDTGALDKTWKEIHDALTNGYYVSVVLIEEMVNSAEQSQITVASALGGQYSVGVGLGDGQNWYSTDSEDGYPVPET